MITQTRETADVGEVETICPKLTKRFDNYSMNDKLRMIEEIAAIYKTGKLPNGERLTKEARMVIKEIELFYRRRLKN